MTRPPPPYASGALQGAGGRAQPQYSSITYEQVPSHDGRTFGPRPSFMPPQQQLYQRHFECESLA